MAAVAASALLLGTPVLVASAVVVAGAVAANAADAGALAAADILFSDSAGVADPCAAAETLADAHGATLDACDLVAETVAARVRVRLRVGVVLVTREAHAGLPQRGDSLASERSGAASEAGRTGQG